MWDPLAMGRVAGSSPSEMRCSWADSGSLLSAVREAVVKKKLMSSGVLPHAISALSLATWWMKTGEGWVGEYSRMGRKRESNHPKYPRGDCCRVEAEKRELKHVVVWGLNWFGVLV